MKRLLLGAVIGSVAMFLWGFLFWGVLPFGNQAIAGADDSAAAQQALAAVFAETGTYLVPFSEDPSDPGYQTLHKAGPIAFVVLSPLMEALGRSLPYISQLNSSQQSTLLFALLVIAFLIFEPLGLYGIWLRIKRYFLAWPFSY